MHFTSGINRPPYEADSAFLQITQGCSHNGCLFCSYYKGDRFQPSSLDEIEADIRELPHYFGQPQRIFLQAADAFAASYDTLMKVSEWLHRYVPSVKEIGGYARIDNFCNKTESELQALCEAGYKNPYIGVESGDDALLEFMNKGYDAAMAREQLEKLDDAGWKYVVNWINGLGGHGYGFQHAEKTAELYRGLHPSMIDISSLVLIPKTGLWYRAQRGEYKEAGEVERLEELKAFLRALDNHTVFQAEHISVPLQIKAELPRDKEDICAAIDRLIREAGEKNLRRFREEYASQGYSVPEMPE